jgi:hypothetical protein
LKRKNIAGEGFASLAHRMLWCQLRKARFEALPEALGQRKPLFGSATKKNAEKKWLRLSDERFGGKEYFCPCFSAALPLLPALM